MNPAKPTLNLLVLKTNNLQPLFEFYSDLGIDFEYHQHGNGPHHYASKGINPVIEIYPLPKQIPQPDTTTRLGFSVENLDQLIEILKTKETSIVTEPSQTPWGYVAIIQDPDGRKIELTEKS